MKDKPSARNDRGGGGGVAAEKRIRLAVQCTDSPGFARHYSATQRRDVHTARVAH